MSSFISSITVYNELRVSAMDRGTHCGWEFWPMIQQSVSIASLTPRGNEIINLHSDRVFLGAPFYPYSKIERCDFFDFFTK